VVREDTHQQTAVHAEPVVQQREPVVEHRTRPNHPEGALALDWWAMVVVAMVALTWLVACVACVVCVEEALVEVVADPEAVKRKEEEQAAKEAARMERLLAKKFIV
jgi:hypothetical protein